MNKLGLATDFEWRRQEDLGRLHDEALRYRENELGSLHAEALKERESRAITYDQFQSSVTTLGPPSIAGPTVTQYTAFQVSAWWCGINVIAGDIGVLDFDLYKRVGEEGDREKVRNHPVAKVLEQPNEYMVPKIFWQTLMAHALGWGNAYAEIEWDNAMRPIALWPIMPNEIEPVVTVAVDARGRKRTKLGYRYRGQDVLAAEDVLHIPGLGFDGICGYSVVSLARQSLGLSLAAERFEGAFFGNGTWTGLVLEHPRQLTKDAADRIRASVQEMHKGAEAAFKLFVAEEGMKVGRAVTTAPKDAQAAEIREGQLDEAARWLNLPPHKIKHRMGDRPGGNLESSETDYHTTTLLPWTTLIDQLCNRKLVSAAQRATYYTEHSYGRRLQPTPLQRMAIQTGYYKIGVLDEDQIARQENLPKPKPKSPPAPAPEAVPPPPADPGLAASAQRTLLLDVAGRFVRREFAAARRAARKGAADFQAWAETHFAEESDVLRSSLKPAVGVLLAMAGSGVDAGAIVDGYVTRYMTRSKGELLGLPARDLEAAVRRHTERLETARTVQMADEIAALVAAQEKNNGA